MSNRIGRAVLCGVLGGVLIGPGSSIVAQPASPGAMAAVNGTTLYYEECGSGPQTSVLLHDGVVNSHVWDYVWPEFCRHFHTIRYDRRGYGRSPAATTWYSETDDLRALLHFLKASRVAIVGSSHGGEVSINFALHIPMSSSSWSW